MRDSVWAARELVQKSVVREPLLLSCLAWPGLWVGAVISTSCFHHMQADNAASLVALRPCTDEPGDERGGRRPACREEPGGSRLSSLDGLLEAS